MRVKVGDLNEEALDWAVAKCENKILVFFDEYFIRNALASGASLVRAESLLYFQPLKGRWCWLNSVGVGNAVPGYSTDWAQGGPIIEREGISLEPLKEGDGWCACFGCTVYDFLMWDQSYNADAAYGEGPTPLIAAMRCYVASKMGDDISLPEGLLR